MKLLVVDDAVSLRKRLVCALDEIGGLHVVGQTGRAQDALNRFRHLHPDIVTLDIQLPGGKNGIYVLKVIKEEAPTTVVIIFTNHGTQPYRDRCRAVGADYFFEKSCDLKELLTTLRKLTTPSRRTTPCGRSNRLLGGGHG